MAFPKPGVQLKQTHLLDEHHTRKLAYLSITTIEELLSFAQESPQFLSGFLEVTNLDRLLSTAVTMASAPISKAELEELRKITYSFGALPPAEQLIPKEAGLHEDVVSPATKPEADLRGCFGPVRDQARRGTCVAFAATAVRECLLNKHENRVVDLSEQFMYYLCKVFDRSPNDVGTWLEVAIPLIVRWGICEEKTWPYNPVPILGNEGQGPPPANAVREAKAYSIREGRCYSPVSVQDIQQRLAEGSPVAISVPVYPIGRDSTFELPVVKKTGNILMPIPNTVPDGGHAVCLAGYAHDDAFAGGGYFIVRNSWGRTWGIQSPYGQGYGTIPFNYIKYYGWEAFSLEP